MTFQDPWEPWCNDAQYWHTAVFVIDAF